VLTNGTTQFQVLAGGATQSGVISESGGSFGLVKTGTGSLALTGVNTYTGSTVIGAGTLQLSGAGSVSSSSTLSVGGTFDISAATAGASIKNLFSLSTTSSVVLGNQTLTITSGTPDSGNSAFFGNISGSGGVLISGGTSVFAGVNTYTGTTTIANGAELDVSNVATSIAASSNVIVNGTLGLNSVGATIASLSGSGSVLGPLTLTNASGSFSGSIGSGSAPSAITIAGGTETFSGAIVSQSFTINAGARANLVGPSGFALANDTLTVNGTLDISGATSGPSPQFLSGSGAILLGNNTLTLSNFAGTGFVSTFSGIISGTGGVTIAGGTGGSGANRILAGNNTYTGTTAIQSGGTLQIGNGGTTGAIVSDVTDSGTLVFNRSDTTVYAGVISGTGVVKQAGTGTLILTGTNIYTGATTSSGTLQIGNGGTTGSISSDIILGGTVGVGASSPVLIFDRSDNVTYSNAISNILPSDALIKQGAGILTLAGTNNFSGTTTVSAGTLNVTGSLASSSITVQSGAVLSGTGKVGTTVVASSGSLNAGSGTTPGTLSVTGNLTLASGASYLTSITPAAAGLTSISGTASVNGNVIASFGAGTYAASERFTILTAAGGVSGTFASLSGLPASMTGQLSYDANNVYLNLSPKALAPLVSGASGNQLQDVAAIDAATAAGNVPSGGFATLYGLSGAALKNALDQISGKIGANIVNAVGQSFFSFMSMTSEGGAGGAGHYAPGSAYDAAAAPHRAQLDIGETRVWGGAYGGHVSLSADAASGAAGLSASNVGLIGGADMQLGDGILAGVTLDWGRQNFNSGNGTGLSTDYAFGLYGRADQGPAYVTAAFGYGWHQITTLRVVTVSGTDVLQGKQNADDFGGRIEAGWRMALDDTYTIAPYGAFAGESFESPAYAETALAGASTFALSYAAHTSTLGRSELGAHLDRSYDLANGALSADIKAAWAHQLGDLPFAQANFENLATASFQVLGVRPARDMALLGADIELQYRSGLFLGLKGEGQFGAGTTILEGMGNLGLRW
jgi:autotransporter-associated beta strand protein